MQTVRLFACDFNLAHFGRESFLSLTRRQHIIIAVVAVSVLCECVPSSVCSLMHVGCLRVHTFALLHARKSRA